MLALKIIGWVLLGLLALIVLLLVVPVRLRVKYADELKATLWVLFVPIRLAPKKEKPEKENKTSPEKKKKSKKEKPENEKRSKIKEALSLKEHAKDLKKNGISVAVEWLKELVSLLLTATDRLLQSITVTSLFARLEVAAADAAQTALNYGKLCAAVFPALGIVESKLKVKKQSVTITPAFCAEETVGEFDARISVSVWRVLFAALCLLIGYIKMPTVGEIKQNQNQQYTNDKEVI